MKLAASNDSRRIYSPNSLVGRDLSVFTVVLIEAINWISKLKLKIVRTI